MQGFRRCDIECPSSSPPPISLLRRSLAFLYAAATVILRRKQPPDATVRAFLFRSNSQRNHKARAFLFRGVKGLEIMRNMSPKDAKMEEQRIALHFALR